VAEVDYSALLKTFMLCLIPILVAVDPPGILPMFASLTKGIDPERRSKLVFSSALTALIVGTVFIATGDRVLSYMGITMADFTIAGGIVLLMVSVTDLITTEKLHRQVDPESLGPVPIGVPLIVGPAVLTTGLLLRQHYGFWMTFAALFVCVAVTAAALLATSFFQRVVGKTAEQVLSKLASLLLAALAVMLIRKGIVASFF
jgi:multiple antibiotic resistance protein